MTEDDQEEEEEEEGNLENPALTYKRVWKIVILYIPQFDHPETW